MTYDFRHAAMHTIADWSVLEQIVREKKSTARLLDSRMVAALYKDASDDSWDQMSDAERDFANAAIQAHGYKR